MGLHGLTAAEQPLAIDASDSRVHLGTSITYPPPRT